MDSQTLLVRRLVAAGAVVLVVVLLVVLVKGCVDNRREAALKDYNRSVRALVEQSRNEVAKAFFDALGSAGGQDQRRCRRRSTSCASTPTRISRRRSGSTRPTRWQAAQTNLELVLSLRRDGVATVADEIQTALGGTAGAGTAVDAIAGQMQAFNASDVLYSQRVAPLILKGLKDDGIAASYDGTAGEQVLPYASFLPDAGGISWFSPDFVAQQLGSVTSSGRPSGTPSPGLHGHQLDSVSVNGVDLTTTASNRIAASPPPTFVVSFTNGGENDETNVKVTVEIDAGGGSPIRAQAIVPSTTAGQAADGERDAETVALDERLRDDQSDDRPGARRGDDRQQHGDVHRAVRRVIRGAGRSRRSMPPPYPLQPWTS